MDRVKFISTQENRKARLIAKKQDMVMNINITIDKPIKKLLKYSPIRIVEVDQDAEDEEGHYGGMLSGASVGLDSEKALNNKGSHKVLRNEDALIMDIVTHDDHHQSLDEGAINCETLPMLKSKNLSLLQNQ